MIPFNYSEEKKYVGIPKRFEPEEEPKSCLIDRNSTSRLPFKSRVPLFGTNETKNSENEKNSNDD